MESDDAVREQLLEPNAEGLTSLLRELARTGAAQREGGL